jgi:2-polyprenyl-3-methyl-5-hydroxy-6-metoxy-1,4-benzoquinol methylase
VPGSSGPLPMAPQRTGEAAACLACGSRNRHVVGRVAGDQLARAYRQGIGLVVDHRYAVDYSLHRCAECQGQWFDPIQSGDAEFYDRLAASSGYYQVARAEHLAAKALIQPGQLVLEVGAGSGDFADSLADVDYTGLELSDEAAATATARGLRVVTEPLDGHVARHAAHYDFACAFQVLEHVEQPVEMLTAMAAAVRPGGLVAVSVPDNESFLGRQVNNVLNLPPHHMTRWTPSALAAAAQAAGLRVRRIENLPLEAAHYRAYANTLVVGVALRLLRRPRRLIDPGLVKLPVRLAVAVVSRPLSLVLSRRRSSLRGHTLYGVFERPTDT